MLKGFIIKVTLFLSPFLVLLLLGTFLYSRSGGDLNRLGKVSYPMEYRDQFNKAFYSENTWFSFSEITSVKIKDFDILTIGDSFSNTQGSTYQNYLVDSGFKVLNFDIENYVIDDYNPSKFLNEFILNGYLDTIHVDYIILQTVERNFIKDTRKMYSEEVSPFNFQKREEIIENKTNIKSYLNDIHLYYRYGLFYIFSDRAFQSQVYKFSLNMSLFSIHEKQLLCYANDISNIGIVTDKSMYEVESNLTKLKMMLLDKGIKLIVLPAPDKYDVYYEFIKDNKYPKNPFFEKLSLFKDSTLVVNSKQVFQPYLREGVKDIYLADDTHWSSKGANIIARHLVEIIESDRKN